MFVGREAVPHQIEEPARGRRPVRIRGDFEFALFALDKGGGVVPGLFGADDQDGLDGTLDFEPEAARIAVFDDPVVGDPLAGEYLRPLFAEPGLEGLGKKIGRPRRKGTDKCGDDG